MCDNWFGFDNGFCDEDTDQSEIFPIGQYLHHNNNFYNYKRELDIVSISLRFKNYIFVFLFAFLSPSPPPSLGCNFHKNWLIAMKFKHVVKAYSTNLFLK